MPGEASTRRERIARIAVALAALWVLGVSSIKLVKGDPGSLPPVVRDGFFGPELNFRLSIAVELSFALVALVWPRRGFAPLAALYAVFVAILVQLLLQGAESCGCFGGAIKFPPALMISVDGSLLAFLLLSRPWKAIQARKTPYLAVAAAALIGAAQPWLGWIPDQLPTPKIGEPAAAVPPSELPRFVMLEPETWTGKSIHETQLAPWVDTYSLPGDGTWILWRSDCPHCQTFLRRLKSEFDADPKFYVFVELPPDGSPFIDRELDMPPGEHAQVPFDRSWPIDTPWELQLEGHTVKGVVDRTME